MTHLASPASTGPAGSYFEGQIGAHYLLSMLCGAEPRGLAGTTISRIALQGAPEGRSLDDVIVHAHDAQGGAATLEIQVKRRITFTSTDPVFQSVVAQIVEAARRPDFWNTRYELAVAIARTSHKIDGAYQDVLTWARQFGDAATFFDRIERPGLANPAMRTFVRTFRDQLKAAGGADDYETVWRLLRKLQILVFDFTAQGSASEALAKEMAARALDADEAPKAGELWTALVDLALRIAATGGERTRERLIQDLRDLSYRLVGERRHSSARAALAEACRHALDDIGDRVGNVTLTRHERIASVHAALDEGRYVEIRGDAGVGKSGVLKHFAEQLSAESQIIVLTPGRTTPGGWNAMRAVIDFKGSARELLSDLTANGGATLFLDGLDMFDERERLTVIDLVREAGSVPGMAVVATTRSNFGVVDTDWLPADVVGRLGRAAPVVIDELSDAEVEELRHADSRLAPLLANGHPARDVARNLFRLARLIAQQPDAKILRTEVDMAEQWWQSADGRNDSAHRERARLLKALAEQALLLAEALDVSDRFPEAINALIKSETLRDLGHDRVAFRHDVLREWAVANLLTSEPQRIGALRLDRPAPPTLARGIELMARMRLEHAFDAAQWQSLLEQLSREGVHGSWRRATLLALVRSEIAMELLTCAWPLLFADRANLLRELIRTVMAIEVEPAVNVYAGLDALLEAKNIHVPTPPSWLQLIFWIFALKDRLPASAIPEVVDLYVAWSVGQLRRDPLTPFLVERLYTWLMEIERAHDADTLRNHPVPFGGEIDHRSLVRLEYDLRTGFLLFCRWQPTLAAEYLRWLMQSCRNEDTVSAVLKFRGTLAQAAPAELAEFTAGALIPKVDEEEEERDGHSSVLPEAFTSTDRDFLPPSPVQGPFFDLLTHAPIHGLALIHRLVDHVVAFYSNGRAPGPNVITIPFADGDRDFPWRQSYGWSRGGGGNVPYSVASALMALEAWAHQRLDAGAAFGDVLGDVLGSTGTPAAYLLVAIDIVLSHWPTSRAAAVPFLACPELLVLDRERQVRDALGEFDPFGFRALQKEPVGPVTLDSLKKRPSRGRSLDALIGAYALEPDDASRDLGRLLGRAAERLGTPAPESTLNDPALMARYALNRLDPDNYRATRVEIADGASTIAYEYVSPQSESEHFERLRQDKAQAAADSNMQFALIDVLDKTTRPSIDFVVKAIQWAQAIPARPPDDDEQWMREQAILSAALLLVRDGDANLIDQCGEWARGLFMHALQTSKEDPVHRSRRGLRYNPMATAFAGMIYLLKTRNSIADVRFILEIAARENPAAAHGLRVSATTLAAVDERLPRSVLRTAFAASIKPHRRWDAADEDDAKRKRREERVRRAIDAEIAWLAGHADVEPSWATFPSEAPRRLRRLRIGGVQDIEQAQPESPEEYVDSQAAALWLGNAFGLIDVAKRPWLRQIIESFADWTAEANGANFDPHEEVSSPPDEWNRVYFSLSAYCLPGLTSVEIDRFSLALIASLPDQSFYAVVAIFLPTVDTVYFDGYLQEGEAVYIRATLARRLMATGGWHRLAGDRSASIAMRIAPAVAAFVFNEYTYTDSRCYLSANDLGRADVFLPIIEDLVKSGTCLFVALITLRFLEVSPRPAHLHVVLHATLSWLAAFSDYPSFWVDTGVGRRLCILLQQIYSQDPSVFHAENPFRPDVDRVLASLVRFGIPEAARFETQLLSS